MVIKDCHRHCLLCFPKYSCETEKAWSISSIFNDEQIDLSALSELEQGSRREKEESGEDKHPLFASAIQESLLGKWRE
jgi:hypothetical protein